MLLWRYQRKKLYGNTSAIGISLRQFRVRDGKNGVERRQNWVEKSDGQSVSANGVVRRTPSARHIAAIETNDGTYAEDTQSRAGTCRTGIRHETPFSPSSRIDTTTTGTATGERSRNRPTDCTTRTDECEIRSYGKAAGFAAETEYWWVASKSGNDAHFSRQKEERGAFNITSK
eukprot:m.15317 g.15317  ORF g.15317 m.15317 type:complete len:174 (+) comp26300_c0_seq1:186-707(+)